MVREVTESLARGISILDMGPDFWIERCQRILKWVGEDGIENLVSFDCCEYDTRASIAFR